MITTLQFIAALFAALLGVFIMRLALHLPATLVHFAIMGAFWSVAIFAYLVPRSATRVLRTRILASVLILCILAFSLCLFVARTGVPVPLSLTLAPLLSLLVFCVASFLTGTRRSWSGSAIVLVPTLVAHFLALWWSYEFRIGLPLKLAAVQLIPLLAATGALVATANLINTGDNPTLT